MPDATVGHDGHLVVMTCGGAEYHLTHEQADALADALTAATTGLSVALVHRLLGRCAQETLAKQIHDAVRGPGA